MTQPGEYKNLPAVILVFYHPANLFLQLLSSRFRAIHSDEESSIIMYLLKDGPVRFNELQRRMPEDMTHTTLSHQLKSLEEDFLPLSKDLAFIKSRNDFITVS